MVLLPPPVASAISVGVGVAAVVVETESPTGWVFPDDAFWPLYGNDDPSGTSLIVGLVRKARAEADPTKRAELYKQVSKIVQREVPRIPLVWSAPPAAATKKVLNARADRFTETGMGK